MAIDPRTPVLVGVGQVQRRPDALTDDLGTPVDLMVDALRAAGDDAGSGSGILQKADSIRVIDLLCRKYTDPAAEIAAALGASPRERVRTEVGGNSPQMVVNDASLMIQRGDLDVVLITGAEAMYTRSMARRAGGRIEWPDAGDEPTRRMGDPRPGSHEAELARGIMMPIQVYPIFECAIRAAMGLTHDEHRTRIAELWSRFSRVAASNPNAWSPRAYTTDEVRDIRPDNRMVGFPYTKLMNANMTVDQAAALVLCSAETAAAAGIAEEKWVFPWSGSDAADHWFVSERADLASSPAMAAIGRAALELAGIGIDDIAHLDLYSCFPSAVQFAADAFGLDAWDESRVPTVTGGLTFAGGPGNNYVTHSIAAMAERLRANPGDLGLVNANGWYATKHSVGVYATAPPEGGFKWVSTQAEVDAGPRTAVAAEHEGDVTVEAYTVMHD
ncbi:MAG: acetyl-CoA acetyltransferase, partial [Acidimicrobiales bacterium]